MTKNSEGLPWILCPVCWRPILFKGDSDHEMRRCENSYCAMVGQNLDLHVFKELTSAQQFAKDNKVQVLLGPKQLFDFESKVLSLWMVATFEGRLDRFRLLEKQPLYKLLPKSFIRSWIADASGASREDLFKVIVVAYELDSGERKVDDVNFPVIEEIGIEKEVGFCPFRELIHNKVAEKCKKGEKYEDPCIKCHKELTKKVSDYAKEHKGEMRLATSSPDHEMTTEQIDNLSSICWAGLMSIGLPILVFDVMVGVGVMKPKHFTSVENTDKHKQNQRKILKELEIEENEFDKLFEKSQKKAMIFKDLTELIGQPYWAKFRENINHFQSLAQNRYGQALSVKLQILTDRIKNKLHEVQIDDFASEQLIWDRVGLDIISEIARFFSFRDFYVFSGEDRDSIRAIVAKSESGRVRSDFSVLDFRDMSVEEVKKKLLEETGMKKEEEEKRGSPIVVNIDHTCWYVFGNELVPSIVGG